MEIQYPFRLSGGVSLKGKENVYDDRVMYGNGGRDAAESGSC